MCFVSLRTGRSAHARNSRFRFLTGSLLAASLLAGTIAARPASAQLSTTPVSFGGVIVQHNPNISIMSISSVGNSTAGGGMMYATNSMVYRELYPGGPITEWGIIRYGTSGPNGMWSLLEGYYTTPEYSHSAPSTLRVHAGCGFGNLYGGSSGGVTSAFDGTFAWDIKAPAGTNAVVVTVNMTTRGWLKPENGGWNNPMSSIIATSTGGPSLAMMGYAAGSSSNPYFVVTSQNTPDGAGGYYSTGTYSFNVPMKPVNGVAYGSLQIVVAGSVLHGLSGGNSNVLLGEVNTEATIVNAVIAQ